MTNLARKIVTEDCDLVIRSHSFTLSELKNSNIVITGGTGFVGTWLIEMICYLNDHYSFGTKITAISKDKDVFENERRHLAGRNDVKIIKSDVRHLLELPRETDWLIHAAANPNSRFHASQPMDTMTTIAEGTAAVLRAATRCANLKMVLNISSGLVYGTQPFDMQMIAESWPGNIETGGVSSCYVSAKKYGESLCKAAHSQLRLPTINVRPFTFVGPYQPLSGPWAVNNFILDAVSNRNIKVLGDGKTERSLMYASDMAFWILTYLTKGEAGQTYNLGSRKGHTVAELAGMVAQNVASHPDIVFNSGMEKSSLSRFVPDTSLSESRFALKQTVGTEAAIKRTIGWNAAF